MTSGTERIGFVVSRFDSAVGNGAEHLCRELAARMARHWSVEILTSCAGNVGPGLSKTDGIAVRRFPVDETRDAGPFEPLSRRVFAAPRNRDDEAAWARSNGPFSRALLDFLRDEGRAYETMLFFDYLSPFSCFGVPLAACPTVLVPAARDEPSLYLDIHREAFEHARGLVFGTPEEQALVNAQFDTRAVCQQVVGVGVGPARDARPERFVQRHLAGLCAVPFVLVAGDTGDAQHWAYVVDYFLRFRHEVNQPARLVLLRPPDTSVPAHPDIVFLPGVDDGEKADALAAAAVVVLPSALATPLTALEAWSQGRPVLVNGACSVLRGECERANGGLWYEDYREFRESLSLLLGQPDLARRLGEEGRGYVVREHGWVTVERKYRDLIERVTA